MCVVAGPAMKNRHNGFSMVSTMLGTSLGLCMVWLAIGAYNQHRQNWLSLDAQQELHARSRRLQLLLTRMSHAAGSAYLILPGGSNSNIQVSSAYAGLQNNSQLTLMLARNLWFPAQNSSDCQGNQVFAGLTSITEPVIANQFKLSSHALSCKDINHAKSIYQSMVDGVEDIGVAYAEQVSSPPAANASSNSYWQWRTSATQVLDWNRVAGFELCLLLNTLLPVPVLASNSQSIPKIQGCHNDQLSRQASDGRMRWVWRQFFSLRSNF